MYRNSLTPSKVFGIVLLLFSGSAALMWLGMLVDPDAVAFDIDGLILLGLSLGLSILSVLFLRRVKWVRIATSVVLHLLILILVVTLPYTVIADLTISEKMAAIALTLFAVGLSFVSILVLQSDGMKQDLAGTPALQAVRRHRKHTGILLVAGCILLFIALGVWRIVPLLIAKPTITVDYLAQANQAIKPANYDPNQNAAPHYEKLFSQFTPLPEILQGKSKAWPAELILNEYEALKQWAPINEVTLPALAEGVRCPYWYYELRSDEGALSALQMPDLKPMRDCTQAVILLAKYKASRGNVDGALQLLTDLNMLGVHRAKGATLLDQLTGIAICTVTWDAMLAIVDHCRVKGDTLKQTLTVLSSRLALINVPQFSEVEHMYGHDRMQRVFTNDGSGNGRLIPAELYRSKKSRPSLYTYPISFLDAIRICLTHPSREETGQLFDAYFAVMKGLAKQTPWDLHAQNTRCDEVLDKLLSGNYYLHDGSAAIAGCIQLGWRGKMLGEGTATVLAVLAYKAKEGRLPESLDQLVGAGLLQRVPMDPYSDASLVYRVTGDNFTLYSVGEDFVDDEGVHCEWNDPAGGDHVFWPVQYPAVEEEETEGE